MFWTFSTIVGSLNCDPRMKLGGLFQNATRCHDSVYHNGASMIQIQMESRMEYTWKPRGGAHTDRYMQDPFLVTGRWVARENEAQNQRERDIAEQQQREQQQRERA